MSFPCFRILIPFSSFYTTLNQRKNPLSVKRHYLRTEIKEKPLRRQKRNGSNKSDKKKRFQFLLPIQTIAEEVNESSYLPAEKMVQSVLPRLMVKTSNEFVKRGGILTQCPFTLDIGVKKPQRSKTEGCNVLEKSVSADQIFEDRGPIEMESLGAGVVKRNSNFQKISGKKQNRPRVSLMINKGSIQALGGYRDQAYQHII